ncbi:MAG TPA: hypothetical protein VIW78_15820 [Burkholderiales bacterium]
MTIRSFYAGATRTSSGLGARKRPALGLVPRDIAVDELAGVEIVFRMRAIVPVLGEVHVEGHVGAAAKEGDWVRLNKTATSM